MLAPILPQEASSDAILTSFMEGIAARGLTLYPAQEEAILDLAYGGHLILNTPTGSGKSLVASFLMYKALCERKRAFYTAPIKALASEKFFTLIHDFGAEHVGLMTGDASINSKAPLVCCTAEILAQMSLAQGAHTPVNYAILDEFHYYSDKERGMSWQLPLICLPQTTFLLMSATLGDVSFFETSLRERTQRDVHVIKTTERPVPLDFQYKEIPLHEVLSDVLKYNKAPVYVVHFTQRESVECAQTLLSVDFCTKDDKRLLRQHTSGFRFDSPFGKDMRRMIEHGIGLHHAGLLPKYRLLVEKLAQQDLLKIIVGTDTLGVGINVPIRTVVFTKLCKFDGEKTSLLSVRDFKQIGGRAGRKGYDTEGHVIVLAPEHIIENKRLEAKASGDSVKMKKLVRQKPPTKNYIPWEEKTLQKLIESPSETLVSQFAITHSMMMSVLQGYQQDPRGGYAQIVRIIERSHERPVLKQRHKRTAALLFKTLRKAGIVTVVRNSGHGSHTVLHESVQHDFSLHQSLSLFCLEALAWLDTADEMYPLHVLSLVESILENPTVILQKQIDKLRTLKMAELKAAGTEFDARIEELDKIEHPKPFSEFLYPTFNAYAEVHPWVSNFNISPKSIARDMYEQCMNFHEYIREYSLQRSEGIVLRYLNQCYKTLAQNIPDSFKNETVTDIETYLHTVIRHADSSLIESWDALLHPKEALDATVTSQRPTRAVAFSAWDPTLNFGKFVAHMRTWMHQFMHALSQKRFDDALTFVRCCEEEPYSWTEDSLSKAIQPFFEMYQHIDTTPRARKPEYTRVYPDTATPGAWIVEQTLLDKEDNNDWVLRGVVYYEDLKNPDEPCLRLMHIGI